MGSTRGGIKRKAKTCLQLQCFFSVAVWNPSGTNLSDLRRLAHGGTGTEVKNKLHTLDEWSCIRVEMLLKVCDCQGLIDTTDCIDRKNHNDYYPDMISLHVSRCDHCSYDDNSEYKCTELPSQGRICHCYGLVHRCLLCVCLLCFDWVCHRQLLHEAWLGVGWKECCDGQGDEDKYKVLTGCICH